MQCRSIKNGWLGAQFAGRKPEPNSGVGKAITYLPRHWRPLTLYLRQAKPSPCASS
jgi:hypothetical protein